MKVYDLIKVMLEKAPQLRDNDKMLLWVCWNTIRLHKKGTPRNTPITYEDLVELPSAETIRRCRAKIQEKFPELGPSENVANLRRKRSDQKGTHIYREEVAGIDQQQKLV